MECLQEHVVPCSDVEIAKNARRFSSCTARSRLREVSSLASAREGTTEDLPPIPPHDNGLDSAKEGLPFARRIVAPYGLQTEEREFLQ